MKGFITWLKPSLEGIDGKAAGKAITAFILTFFLFIILAYSIWYAIYCQVRQSLISANELAAAHYPLELVIPILTLIAALWSVGAFANVMTTKFTNPQPPTNVNVQTDKNIVN